MKAIDLRNATFGGLRAGLDESRGLVMAAWLSHGPGTTRQIATRSGIDILTLRPRTTELLQCGLIQLSGRAGNEGIYSAATGAGWDAWRETKFPNSSGQQMLI